MLLTLGALSLPLALAPLGRLLPESQRGGADLVREAEAAADRVAAALAITGQTMPPGGREAILAAALAGTHPSRDLQLGLIGPEGQPLARSGAAMRDPDAPILAAEHAVPGSPFRVVASRPLTAPRHDGVLPLGAAVLGLLGLALLAHRRERRASAATLAAARQEELRSASFAESAARLRLALAAAELGCWSWDEASDAITWDERASLILGWQPAGVVRGIAVRQRIEPEDRPALDAAFARARRSGEPTLCTIRLRPEEDGPVRWIELRAQATRWPGRVAWHGVIADITARREAEEEQRRLLREVDHRAKNTLAVVQALLRLTRSDNPASFLPRVEARIGALSRAHTLLAQSRWQGASLHRLATGELHRMRRVEGTAQPLLGGPPVMLSPIVAQPLAMVLHELASNAAQHGALARPGGSLSLTWWLDTEHRLNLVWQERQTGILPVPATRGFGLRIIEATVRDQLGGKLTRDWGPEGYRCAIELPPSCILAEVPAAAA